MSTAGKIVSIPVGNVAVTVDEANQLILITAPDGKRVRIAVPAGQAKITISAGAS